MAGYIPVVASESSAAKIKLENNEEKDADFVMSALDSILEYNKQSGLKHQSEVINEDDLSDNMRKMLTEAAEVLQILNSQSLDKNEMLYADKKVGLSKSATEKAFLQLEIHPLLKKNERIITRTGELQLELQFAEKHCKDLQEQQEKKMADKVFLKHKVEELKRTLDDLKGEMQCMAISDLEDNEKLQEKIQCTGQMKYECATLQTEINKYRGLTPNLAKAKELLVQTKQEYEQVCKRLNSQVNRQKRWRTGRV